MIRIATDDLHRRGSSRLVFSAVSLQGGDYGNREEYINKLVLRML